MSVVTIAIVLIMRFVKTRDGSGRVGAEGPVGEGIVLFARCRGRSSATAAVVDWVSGPPSSFRITAKAAA